MAKCWRCGGGKTISVTTTGTHVLPCPTCSGSGELPSAPGDDRQKLGALQYPEVKALPAEKPPAGDPPSTAAKVA
jgi:hypothetical protein